MTKRRVSRKKVVQIPVPPKSEGKKFLHVIVGFKDEWEATPEELDTLAKLFDKAITDPKCSVVVTRRGVKAKLITV